MGWSAVEVCRRSARLSRLNFLTDTVHPSRPIVIPFHIIRIHGSGWKGIKRSRGRTMPSGAEAV